MELWARSIYYYNISISQTAFFSLKNIIIYKWFIIASNCQCYAKNIKQKLNYSKFKTAAKKKGSYILYHPDGRNASSKEEANIISLPSTWFQSQQTVQPNRPCRLGFYNFFFLSFLSQMESKKQNPLYEYLPLSLQNSSQLKSVVTTNEC